MFKLLRASTGCGSSNSGQTVIRCWLKPGILPRDHENTSKAKNYLLDKEDSDNAIVMDIISTVMAIMSTPPSALDSPRPASMLMDNM